MGFKITFEIIKTLQKALQFSEISIMKVYLDVNLFNWACVSNPEKLLRLLYLSVTWYVPTAGVVELLAVVVA